MNRFFAIPSLRLALLAALGALAGHGAMAAEPPANKLQSVEVQQLSGQGLQIVLTTSGPAAEPISFTIDNPARISFDLANTSLALAQRRIDVRKAGLDSIVAAEGNGRSRLVLNMDSLQPYQTRIEGNRIIVTLGENTRAMAAASAPASAAAPAGPATIRMSARRIPKIDFRRGGDGSSTGRLIVSLSDPRTPINLRQQGNRILVDFVGAELAPEFQKSYDVSDFATPVTGFDAIRTASGTQLSINATGDFEQLAYQADDQYVIEIQPRRVAKVQADEKPVYTGERMGANFQDIPTRTLLQLIADTSGKNIVVGDSVTGNMTLKLEDVPWDQALDIVLQTRGLDKRVQDNVIIVGPTEELANRDKARLAARQDLQDLAPVRTEYLQVNYAQATDLAALIQSGGAGGPTGKSLLSLRGSVKIDSRTNMLIIQDTPESITNIRQLVSILDIPVRQVEIEARIVVVNEDFSRDLGVRFGFTGTETNGSNGLFAVTGTAAGADIIGSSALANLAGGGGVYPVTVPTGVAAPSRYNVNLPVTNPAGTLSTMILGSDFLVDLELSAAQAEGKGEVISSPKITARNLQEAYIEQGTEIPYQEAASSGAATVTFKKAVLSLRVTPQINPDNTLILKIIVHKDNVGQLFGTSQVPSIDTRELNTEIVMRDGETAVLGGILETEHRTSERKVPFLGDIPVLGHLFKSTGKVNNKDELLIFVTPRIRREGVRTN
ncbi:MAG: type IV pilus secretin PilQ [Steroidobacteraceae bacterium]